MRDENVYYGVNANERKDYKQLPCVRSRLDIKIPPFI
jgi:hypothetical protein